MPHWEELGAGFALPISCPACIHEIRCGHRRRGLAVSIDAHGNYAIGLAGATQPALISGVAVQIGGTWIHSADYPRHAVATTTAQGILGSGAGMGSHLFWPSGQARACVSAAGVR